MQIILKIVLLMVFPLPAFSCGLATPLCLLYGATALEWMAGGAALTAGGVILQRNLDTGMETPELDLGDIPTFLYKSGSAGKFFLVFESEADDDAELEYLNRELQLNGLTDGYQELFKYEDDGSYNVHAKLGPYDRVTCETMLNIVCDEDEDAYGNTIFLNAHGRIGFDCACVAIH